jgi:hypothetical protein
MPRSYRDILSDDASLADFLNAMKDFDRSFCDSMASGADFTLKLEIHGCGGQMLHARVSSDTFRRPAGADKKAEAKNSRNSV